MKPGTALAIAGLAWTITTTIAGAVLGFVVKIEHRVTRLETLIERPTARATPPQQPQQARI